MNSEDLFNQKTYPSISIDFRSNRTIQLQKGSDQKLYLNAFSVNLVHGNEVDFCNFGHGRAIVHNPHDPPTIVNDNQLTSKFFAELSQSHFIITPKIITADEGLRDLDVNM